MAISELDGLKLPELPPLPAGQLVVNKETWDILVKYIEAQTSTINALITTVESFYRLQDFRDGNANLKINTLTSEVAEIAKALEGEFVDE